MPLVSKEFELLKEYERALAKQGLAPGTARQRAVLLERHALRFQPFEKASPQMFETFFVEASAKWSLSYLRKVHLSMLDFFKWLHETGRISRNPTTEVPKAHRLKQPLKLAKRKPHILDQYATYLRHKGRSPLTIEQRLGDITRFSTKNHSFLEASGADLNEYLLSNAKWSREYRRKIRASLTVFYSWLTHIGYREDNPTSELMEVRSDRSSRKPAPERVVIQAFERGRLIERTIIALASTIGLRRSEIAALHSQSRKGNLLTVHGKGDKLRVIPLNDLTLGLLREIESRHDDLPGYYFPGRNGGHLHPSTVYKLAKALIGPDWCLHSLRHRAATIALRGCKNIRAVQSLLGHASLSSTEIYTEVSLDDILEATKATEFGNPKNREHLSGNGPVKVQTWSERVVMIDLDNVTPEQAALVMQAVVGKLSDRRGLQSA